jgi:hypothetical protein
VVPPGQVDQLRSRLERALGEVADELAAALAATGR